MTKIVLLGATLLNSVVIVAVLVSVILYRSVHVWLFLGFIFLNAALFLVLNRHRRNNPSLNETQSNRWEIALFVGSPVSYLLYVWRHVSGR